jgi:hypothetical protein
MPNKGLMANLPRPLIGLLVATLAFFAVWTVALKPSSSSAPKPSTPAPAPAPAAASASKPQPTASTASHAAAPAKATAAKATAAKTASAKTASTKAAPAKADSAKPASAKTAPAKAAAAKPTATTSQRVALVKSALADHKVLAVLFFNPAASDDLVVKHELAQLPVHGGKVVKLAVPLNELAQYPVITNQVQVTESPTLVLIDGKRQADMLTGFVDQLELNQRVADAIASK